MAFPAFHAFFSRAGANDRKRASSAAPAPGAAGASSSTSPGATIATSAPAAPANNDASDEYYDPTSLPAGIVMPGAARSHAAPPPSAPDPTTPTTPTALSTALGTLGLAGSSAPTTPTSAHHHQHDPDGNAPSRAASDTWSVRSRRSSMGASIAQLDDITDDVLDDIVAMATEMAQLAARCKASHPDNQPTPAADGTTSDAPMTTGDLLTTTVGSKRLVQLTRIATDTFTLVSRVREAVGSAIDDFLADDPDDEMDEIRRRRYLGSAALHAARPRPPASSDRSGGKPAKPKYANAAGTRCSSCGTTQTPEWRRGPEGPGTLCNACGLHYAKMQRNKRKLEQQRLQQQQQAAQGGESPADPAAAAAASSTPTTPSSRVARRASTTSRGGGRSRSRSKSRPKPYDHPAATAMANVAAPAAPPVILPSVQTDPHTTYAYAPPPPPPTTVHSMPAGPAYPGGVYTYASAAAPPPPPPDPAAVAAHQQQQHQHQQQQIYARLHPHHRELFPELANAAPAPPPPAAAPGASYAPAPSYSGYAVQSYPTGTTAYAPAPPAPTHHPPPTYGGAPTQQYTTYQYVPQGQPVYSAPLATLPPLQQQQQPPSQGAYQQVQQPYATHVTGGVAGAPLPGPGGDLGVQQQQQQQGQTQPAAPGSAANPLWFR